MSLDGNDRGLLTSRAGGARADATRCGWAPVDTTAAVYIWTSELGMTTNDISTSWTAEVR
jgi:hypothetical protein